MKLRRFVVDAEELFDLKASAGFGSSLEAIMQFF